MIIDSFRERVYQFLKSTLSRSMTKDDLDIIIHLLALIIGDRDYDLNMLQYYTMIDYTPTDRLHQLGSNVAFPWSSALTPEQQRQYIKLYHLIRQRRGTAWSIENICKVFGQDTASYYSASDLSSVRLLEWPQNYGGKPPVGGSGNELPFCYYEEGAPEYPGDMVLRVPALSTLLEDQIMDNKLAGTRLRYLYYFESEIFRYQPQTNALVVHEFYFDPVYGKDDIKIMDWEARLPQTGDRTTIIRYMEDRNLSPCVVNYNLNGSMTITEIASTPHETGFILNKVDLEDYRGYIINEEAIESEEVLYW